MGSVRDHDLLWTPSQRRALIALLSILTLGLAIRYAFNHTYIADPQPPAGARAAELASQIDPNTATWEELAAIPTLGEKRAKAIVARREQLRSSRPGELPFRSAEDLMKVKGIGAATASNLKPYLLFPTGPRPDAPH